MLSSLGEGLYCAEDSLRMPGGWRFPVRMTVVRLGDGTVALISPIAMDDGLAAEIAAVGPVRFLIAPNLLHHLHQTAARRRWPEAQLVAPSGLAGKRPDLRLDAPFEAPLPGALAAELEAIPIHGAPATSEWVLFHRPSQSLIVTDLVFRILHPQGLATRGILRVMGVNGRLAQSRAWRLFTRDRRAAAASVERILALPLQRLIVAHGEPLLADARPELEQALAWMRAPTLRGG